MVHMRMRQQDVINLLRQLKALRVLWILLDEWIDEIVKDLADMAKIVKDLDDRLRKLESCASHRSWYA